MLHVDLRSRWRPERWIFRCAERALTAGSCGLDEQLLNGVALGEGPAEALAWALLERAACFASGEPFARAWLAAAAAPAAPAVVDLALERLLGLGRLAPASSDALRLAGPAPAEPAPAARRAVEQALCAAVGQTVASGQPSQTPPLLPHLRHLARLAQRERRDDPLAATLYAALGIHLHMAGLDQEALPALECAWAASARARGPEHPASRALHDQLEHCRADLLLGRLPPAGPDQIVAVLVQARAAVEQALADPSADRRALAQALAARARWAEATAAPGGGGWMYVAELRMLIGPLGVAPD